ncbi:hypothetical protein [Alteromonas gilva]|uniref:Lipoprotein n=1 Tax=Alteromonas gilva TaxID=2987522 RepID=A0ABT5L2V8_9ALTE|nr:hypothetical protein [Alteromonas gilva]MDC8831370.1 hypothetical protein [Alteromonas gilva]
MKLMLFFVVLLLSGCTTALWAPNYEQEWVDGFYVKSDSSQLFVTSSNSAYLFNINKNFAEALLLSRKEEFYPYFDQFQLNKDNTIEGDVSLTLADEFPSSELENELIALGFKKDELLHRYKLTENIRGRRYIVEGILPLEKLEKRRQIAVAQPSTFTETAGKIAATPATIVIDSVITVPAVFLGAIVMAAGGS